MTRDRANWPLVGTLVLAACLNLYAIDFPLGYHYDEPKKVQFVRQGTQDFHLPLLMLELARGAVAVVQPKSDQQIAVVGRTVSAASGVAVVLFTFVLARRLMARGWALATALAAAVSPTIVVHAHYFKEDAIFTACMLLSLLALLRFLEGPNTISMIALGIATGLAWSAKYTGALLVLLYLAAPWIAPTPSRRAYFLGLLAAMGIAAWIFATVNWPMFDNFDQFLVGIRHESRHAVMGHDVRYPAVPHFFAFHFWHSLLPGMTPPVVAVGMAGMIWTAARWRQAALRERLLLVFVVGFYLVMELFPLKPDPDSGRYMLPIVPVLICFACRAVETASSAYRTRFRRWPMAFGVVALVVLPLVDSVLLDLHLNRDTRRTAVEWIAATGKGAVFEAHAGVRRDVRSVAELDVAQQRARGVSYLVASSFQYERYYRGSRTRGQSADVYRFHRRYEELFSQFPYAEFKPAYRGFAFSNPTIRVIDITGRRFTD
ncbi:MAG: glycosyltransferase family 39 protein [Planctomycetes bacterium]|nr:glycosyltransferase family 39 protein [Planctomycetota bacterium]